MSEMMFGIGIIVYGLMMLYFLYEVIRNDGPNAELTDRKAVFMVAFLAMFVFAFLVLFHGL